MVPFWVPIIIRHLIFRVPKKGTIIFTTTHLGLSGTRVWVASRVTGALLEGSWDLVISVINRVTTVIITYNPN